MEETFIPFGTFRALVCRKHGIELHSDKNGVLHLALGRARMDIAALDTDGGACRIEILIFQFAYRATVEGVGIFRSELLYIKLHDPASDLLVRSEPDPDVSMLEFGMFHDILNCIHDLRYAGRVVGSEESRAVGGDKRLTFILKHFRKFGRLEAQSRHTL